MANTYMPISIALKDRPCLVVGGGNIALRKVETLMEYETKVTVIAPEIHDKLKFFADTGQIAIEERAYKSPEAATYGLVIAASDDVELNKQVCDDARGGGVLVNVVDTPPLCDFIFPAVLRRESLTAAISTDGKAPFMAGHIRMILDTVFPKHWNRLMKLAADFRRRVQERYQDDPLKKNACYERFLGADWKTILKDLKDPEIEQELARMIDPGDRQFNV
jgi:uroporphyrin-III C-methyltransferase/precorrin-2 dehydrogenase/sirohydrochlorin ferrochelatase